MLKFGKDMSEFLDFSSRNSIISQLLLNGNKSHINPEGNYIKFDGIDTLSFLPLSKFDKVEDFWNNKYRTKIKVGRIVRKFINELSFINYSINDSEIEKFVNLYKSYFNRDTSKLKIVSGDDILKYYNEDTYYIDQYGYKNGSIWNSCMRQSDRNIFMSLYSKNIDSIKMLVLFSDDNKVLARALLWENVKDHKSDTYYKLMDRIYFFYDYNVNFFKDWAKDNGYISKTEQSAKSECLFDGVNGEKVELKLYATLDCDLSYYPYLDTFKHFNTNLKRFSNSDRFKFDYKLIQTNGMCEREEDEDDEYEEEYEDGL